MDIRLAAAQGVEDGNTCIDIATVAVYPDIDPFSRCLRLHELANYGSRRDIAVFTDVTVQKDAAGVLTGYHIKKTVHFSISLRAGSRRVYGAKMKVFRGSGKSDFYHTRLIMLSLRYKAVSCGKFFPERRFLATFV